MDFLGGRGPLLLVALWDPGSCDSPNEVLTCVWALLESQPNSSYPVSYRHIPDQCLKSFIVLIA